MTELQPVTGATKLKDQRPDLWERRLAESEEAYGRATDHVKEDPLGWLMSQASSLDCYIVREEGQPDRLNELLEPVHLQNAIEIMRTAAWHFYANRGQAK